MTKETLKQLIEIEFERAESISQFKSEVYRLLDLYENDRTLYPHVGTSIPIDSSLPDEVPYGSICSCNPANGGNGICGCVMANKMVPNPKRYLYHMSKLVTTTNLQINSDTAFTNSGTTVDIPLV